MASMDDADARSTATTRRPATDARDPLGRLNAAAPAELVSRARRARLVGERKPVTALFVDIVGSTSLAEVIDPEDWTMIINAAFDEMSRRIFEYEGTIAQIQGDALISFFGAPVAHEDDPERAVRAALAIIEAMRVYGGEVSASHGIDFQVRIGVSTGLVLVGNVGSDLRYDYTAIGDTMNLASRLQGAAPPSGILIAERTERFVRPFFEIEDAGLMELKGKADAVRAYRVIRERARPGDVRGVKGLASPMVGRDAELASLVALGSAVHAGLGRVALVISEPGLGKSRLLGELRRTLEADDTTATGGETAWITAHASSFAQRTPFQLTRNLVLDVLGMSAVSSPAEVDEALRSLLARLAPSDPEAHRHLATLLAIPLEDDEAALVSRLSGELLEERILAAVLRLLRRIADQGPLVLAIEDLHWADSASASSIQALLTLVDESALLLVCTTREEPESPGWAVVNTARERIGRGLTEIRLAPLAREPTRELVANLLEIESLPERTRELILAKSEGNPFFVEEVIRMLIERGAIERREDRWVATAAVTAMEIPDTVHGLILSRVDRLPQDARRVLRLASCIDRQFPVPLLEDVARAGGDDHALGGALGRLEAANLVTLAATVPELEYRFSHALIQDAAHETILRQERREWHMLIAEALLARYPEREAEWSDRLAGHFEEAGEATRAIHYLLMAARRALRHNAHADARVLIARAAALVPRLQEPESDEGLRLRLGVAMGRIVTQFLFMRSEETAELIRDARALAERLSDRSSLADTLFWEVLLRRAMGERPETSPELAGLMERLDQGDTGGDEVQRAMVLYQMGLILWLTGDFDSSLHALRQAVPLMAARGDVIGAAMVEGFMAADYAAMGDFERADQRMAAFRAHAEEADELARLDYQLAEAAIATVRGDYAKSLRYAGDCFSSASKMGALACASVSGVVLGASLLGVGDATQARLTLERTLELAAQGYLAPQRMRAGVFLASVDGMSGDLAGAEKGFGIALHELTSLGNPYAEAEAQLMRGLVLATHPDGDPDEALRILEGSRSLFESIGARPSLARTQRARAMALERLGRRDEARAALAESARLARQMGLLDGPWPGTLEELEAAQSVASPIDLME